VTLLAGFCAFFPLLPRRYPGPKPISLLLALELIRWFDSCPLSVCPLFDLRYTQTGTLDYGFLILIFLLSYVCLSLAISYIRMFFLFRFDEVVVHKRMVYLVLILKNS
jgi:hypothetical protein